MITSFDNLILGHYNNKQQAYSNPTKWPQVHILYSKIKSNVLELKQWYNYEGEDKPYRHYHITINYQTHDTAYTRAHNLLTDTPGCEMQWGYFGTWWFGSVKGECIVPKPDGDTYVVSDIQFDGDMYMSRDTGYYCRNDKFAWGKEEGEGMFTFTRLNNGRKLDYTL